MKKRKQFIQLLSIAVLLFAFATACDKTDDPGGDTPSAGTVKDADGNKYNTVKIGNQVWMVENLKTTKYNDGTPIPNETDNNVWSNLSTGAYCNYDNLESTAEINGRLYNWYAVNTGKLAPAGWHVPTDGDWTILENFVAASTGTSGNVAKALASKINWAASTEVGAIGNDLTINNSSGFTALPGGFRGSRSGTFLVIGLYGNWWSSTENDEGGAYYRHLTYNFEDLFRGYNNKENGFSVRLVRD